MTDYDTSFFDAWASGQWVPVRNREIYEGANGANSNKRSNRVASPGDRIVETYGHRLVYPDRITPVRDYWRGINDVDVAALYVIGRGEYKIHATQIDDASSYTHPNSLRVPTFHTNPSQPLAWRTVIGSDYRGFPFDYPVPVFSGQLELSHGAWTAFFRVPLTRTRLLWFDLAFPDGLYSRAADTISGTGKFVQYQLRPVFGGVPNTGALTPVTVQPLNTANRSDAFRQTFAVPVSGSGIFAGCDAVDIQFRNLSPPIGATTSDASYLARVAAVIPVEQPVIENGCAILWGETYGRANEAPPVFAVEVERVLPSVSVFGNLGAPIPTRSVVEAIASVVGDSGQALASVDFAALHAIRDTLRARGQEGLQYHNAVHDQPASVRDELLRVCGSANITPYRRGAELRFVRDGASLSRDVRAVITRRNSNLESVELGIGFESTEDPDAVELTYYDQGIGWAPRVATYPAITEPTRPDRVTYDGVTTWAQAWALAGYRWLARRGRRDWLRLQVMDEVLPLDPLDVVLVEDLVREPDGQEYSGRVIGQPEANQLTFDRPLPEGMVLFTPLTIRPLDAPPLQVLFYGFDSDDRRRCKITSSPGALTFPTSSQQGWVLYSVFLAAEATSRRWLVVSCTPTDGGWSDLNLVEEGANIHDGEGRYPYEPPAESVPTDPLG